MMGWLKIGGVLAVAALLAGVWFHIQGQARTIRQQAAAIAERDAEVSRANDSLRAMQAEQERTASALRDATAAHERAMRAVQEAQRLADARAATINDIKRQVIDAPASDDGNISPVLRRVLDGLRVQSAHSAGNASRDGPGSGAPVPARKPADLSR